MSSKGNNHRQSGGQTRRGFLPDFSRYLYKYYPIDDAFDNADLVEKLKGMVANLLTVVNPMREMQSNGFCKKFEKMTPQKDKDFLRKCYIADCYPYYASFGDNAYRIVVAIDTNTRIAYFLALDTKHSIR